jgi:hypothetical protein
LQNDVTKKFPTWNLEMQNFLNNLESLNSTSETMISLCFIEKSISDILLYLEDQLAKIQKVGNSNKRKKLNDNLYRLIVSLKNKNPELVFSTLYFIDDEQIHSLDLTNHQISLSKEYKFINPYYKSGEKFECAYFSDFFLNNKFLVYIQLQKLKVSAKQWTLTKEKSWTKDHKDDKELEKYLEELKMKYGIVYINGFKSTNFNPQWLVKMENHYSRSDFFVWVEKNKQLQHHKSLEKRLEDLQNSKTNLDLYVFGKLKQDILVAIENYQLKELYIERKKLEKLKTLVDADALNFTIIPIDTIERGDVGDRFIQDYNGLMGIRYFV